MLNRTIVSIAVVVLVLFSRPVLSQPSATRGEQICDVSADAALGLEDYPAAIRLHRSLLRLHPNDALAHYHLGFAYGMTGHSSKEIDEYRRAVTLGLRSWDLFLNLGLAYAEGLDFANAAQALQHAVLLAPQRPEAHFNLALAYEKENRFKDALREIKISRRLDPGDLDAQNTEAILCAELDDRTCAHNLWTHLIQIAPEYYPARMNLRTINRTSCATPVDLQPVSGLLKTPAGRKNQFRSPS